MAKVPQRSTRISTLAAGALVLVATVASATPFDASAPSVTRDSPTGAIQLAGFGKRDRGTGAFKPDPIYGGGRGRDPYGAPLDSDPYRGNSNPNSNIRFAPPNAGLHGPMNARPKKDDREKAEEEAAPKPRRKQSAEDNRANRDAQRAGEEAE